MSETLAEPQAGPEVISQGIIDATNQAFERLSGRLAPYIADKRRDRKHDGTTLSADNEGVLWEGGEYGQIPIHIANQASRMQVWQAFLQYHARNRTMEWPAETGQHHELIKHANERSDPDRYKPVAAIFLLHAMRDRYPRDDTDWRESLMPLHRDYSQIPDDQWGERHKVGVELRIGYEDALAPQREAEWRFGMSVQTRFDMPAPQTEIRSRFRGLVDTFDIDMVARKGLKPEYKKTEETTGSDLAHMVELFGMAKDIRPNVTPIDRQLRGQAAVAKMFERFVSTDRLESSAPVE